MKSFIKKYIVKFYDLLLNQSYHDKDKVKLKFLIKLNNKYKIKKNKYLLFKIVRYFNLDDQAEIIPIYFNSCEMIKYTQSEQEDIIAQVSYLIDINYSKNEMMWDRMANGCFSSKKIFLTLFQNGFYPMYYYAINQKIVANSKSFDGHLIQMSKSLIEEFGVNTDNYLLNSSSWTNSSIEKELIPYFL